LRTRGGGGRKRVEKRVEKRAEKRAERGRGRRRGRSGGGVGEEWGRSGGRELWRMALRGGAAGAWRLGCKAMPLHNYKTLSQGDEIRSEERHGQIKRCQDPTCPQSPRH
jgi:hypothetical protein